jgi:hypothetical protein
MLTMRRPLLMFAGLVPAVIAVLLWAVPAAPAAAQGDDGLPPVPVLPGEERAPADDNDAPAAGADADAAFGAETSRAAIAEFLASLLAGDAEAALALAPRERRGDQLQREFFTAALAKATISRAQLVDFSHDGETMTGTAIVNWDFSLSPDDAEAAIKARMMRRRMAEAVAPEVIEQSVNRNYAKMKPAIDAALKSANQPWQRIRSAAENGRWVVTGVKAHPVTDGADNAKSAAFGALTAMKLSSPVGVLRLVPAANRANAISSIDALLAGVRVADFKLGDEIDRRTQGEVEVVTFAVTWSATFDPDAYATSWLASPAAAAHRESLVAAGLTDDEVAAQMELYAEAVRSGAPTSKPVFEAVHQRVMVAKLDGRWWIARLYDSDALTRPENQPADGNGESEEGTESESEDSADAPPPPGSDDEPTGEDDGDGSPEDDAEPSETEAAADPVAVAAHFLEHLAEHINRRETDAALGMMGEPLTARLPTALLAGLLDEAAVFGTRAYQAKPDAAGNLKVIAELRIDVDVNRTLQGMAEKAAAADPSLTLDSAFARLERQYGEPLAELVETLGANNWFRLTLSPTVAGRRLTDIEPDADMNARDGAESLEDALKRLGTALKVGDSEEILLLTAPNDRRGWSPADDPMLKGLKVSDFMIEKIDATETEAVVQTIWAAELDTAPLVEMYASRVRDLYLTGSALPQAELDRLATQFNAFAEVVAGAFAAGIARPQQAVTLRKDGGRWYVVYFFDGTVGSVAPDAGGATPAEAAQKFVAALANADPAGLYRMLPPDQRSSYSPEFLVTLLGTLTVTGAEPQETALSRDGSAAAARIALTAAFDHRRFVRLQMELTRAYARSVDENPAGLAEGTRVEAAPLARRFLLAFRPDGPVSLRLDLSKHSNGRWFAVARALDPYGAWEDAAPAGDPAQTVEWLLACLATGDSQGVANAVGPGMERCASIDGLLAGYGADIEGFTIGEAAVDGDTATVRFTMSGSFDAEAATEAAVSVIDNFYSDGMPGEAKMMAREKLGAAARAQALADLFASADGEFAATLVRDATGAWRVGSLDSDWAFLAEDEYESMLDALEADAKPELPSTGTGVGTATARGAADAFMTALAAANADAAAAMMSADQLDDEVKQELLRQSVAALRVESWQVRMQPVAVGDGAWGVVSWEAEFDAATAQAGMAEFLVGRVDADAEPLDEIEARSMARELVASVSESFAPETLVIHLQRQSDPESGEAGWVFAYFEPFEAGAESPRDLVARFVTSTGGTAPTDVAALDGWAASMGYEMDRAELAAMAAMQAGATVRFFEIIGIDDDAPGATEPDAGEPQEPRTAVITVRWAVNFDVDVAIERMRAVIEGDLLDDAWFRFADDPEGLNARLAELAEEMEDRAGEVERFARSFLAEWFSSSEAMITAGYAPDADAWFIRNIEPVRTDRGAAGMRELTETAFDALETADFDTLSRLLAPSFADGVDGAVLAAVFSALTVTNPAVIVEPLVDAWGYNADVVVTWDAELDADKAVAALTESAGIDEATARMMVDHGAKIVTAPLIRVRLTSADGRQWTIGDIGPFEPGAESPRAAINAFIEAVSAGLPLELLGVTVPDFSEALPDAYRAAAIASTRSGMIDYAEFVGEPEIDGDTATATLALDGEFSIDRLMSAYRAALVADARDRFAAGSDALVERLAEIERDWAGNDLPPELDGFDRLFTAESVRVDLERVDGRWYILDIVPVGGATGPEAEAGAATPREAAEQALTALQGDDLARLRRLMGDGEFNDGARILIEGIAVESARVTEVVVTGGRAVAFFTWTATLDGDAVLEAVKSMQVERMKELGASDEVIEQMLAQIEEAFTGQLTPIKSHIERRDHWMQLGRDAAGRWRISVLIDDPGAQAPVPPGDATAPGAAGRAVTAVQTADPAMLARVWLPPDERDEGPRRHLLRAALLLAALDAEFDDSPPVVTGTVATADWRVIVDLNRLVAPDDETVPAAVARVAGALHREFTLAAVRKAAADLHAELSADDGAAAAALVAGSLRIEMMLDEETGRWVVTRMFTADNLGAAQIAAAKIPATAFLDAIRGGDADAAQALLTTFGATVATEQRALRTMAAAAEFRELAIVSGVFQGTAVDRVIFTLEVVATLSPDKALAYLQESKRADLAPYGLSDAEIEAQLALHLAGMQEEVRVLVARLQNPRQELVMIADEDGRWRVERAFVTDDDAAIDLTPGAATAREAAVRALTAVEHGRLDGLWVLLERQLDDDEKAMAEALLGAMTIDRWEVARQVIELDDDEAVALLRWTASLDVEKAVAAGAEPRDAGRLLMMIRSPVLEMQMEKGDDGRWYITQPFMPSGREWPETEKSDGSSGDSEKSGPGGASTAPSRGGDAEPPAPPEVPEGDAAETARCRRRPRPLRRETDAAGGAAGWGDRAGHAVAGRG